MISVVFLLLIHPNNGSSRHNIFGIIVVSVVFLLLIHSDNGSSRYKNFGIIVVSVVFFSSISTMDLPVTKSLELSWYQWYSSFSSIPTTDLPVNFFWDYRGIGSIPPSHQFVAAQLIVLSYHPFCPLQHLRCFVP